MDCSTVSVKLIVRNLVFIRKFLFEMIRSFFYSLLCVCVLYAIKMSFCGAVVAALATSVVKIRRKLEKKSVFRMWYCMCAHLSCNEFNSIQFACSRDDDSDYDSR